MEDTAEATPTQEPEPEVRPEEVPAVERPAEQPPRGERVLKMVGLVALAVLIVAILSAMLYGLVTHPPLTAILRDLSIIVLALVTIVTSIFLAILLFQLQSLIVLLRDEIYPILQSVNQTANTVRGTTNFVSDAVVSPMISAASYVSGVRETLRVLAGGGRKRAGQPSQPSAAAPPPEERPSVSGNDFDQT